MMKKIVLGACVAVAVGLFGGSIASAAPVSGGPIAHAAGEAGSVVQVWYDRYGRWHPNRRAYRRGPVCRTSRVCGPRGCFVRRRCY